MTIAITIQQVTSQVAYLITIVLAAGIVGATVRKVIFRVLSEVDLDKISRINVGAILAIISEYTCYLGGAYLIAEDLEITNYVTLLVLSIVGALVIGNLTLFIGFSLINIISSIRTRQKFIVGQKVKGTNWTIVKKRLTHIVAREKDDRFVVPYRHFSK
jgi:hypothetical protein